MTITRAIALKGFININCCRVPAKPDCFFFPDHLTSNRGTVPLSPGLRHRCLLFLLTAITPPIAKKIMVCLIEWGRYDRFFFDKWF